MDAAHVEILSRTPATLQALLGGLSGEWLHTRESAESWSPFEVVGHLVHGEQTDWLPRIRILLEHGEQQTFPPFDRAAHIGQFAGRPVQELLDRFADLRGQSLAELQSLALGEAQLRSTGSHPDFGRVTLSQLMATWVVHDLGHIAQISRVLARRWGDEVGPWRAYLPVLTR